MNGVADRAAGALEPAAYRVASVSDTPDSSQGPVGFDRLYGLEVVSASVDEVVAEIAVTDAHLQPFGLVHGGVVTAMAESTASVGTWLGVREAGMLAMGQANQTSFLRPLLGPRVRATARPVHRGRATWVWDVDVTDDEGRVCAVSRMTIAVRAPRT